MKLPPALIAPVVGALYRLWCGSLRYTESNREACLPYIRAQAPLVFALWHDELFALPYTRGDWSVFTVVSRSRDGEYLARLLQSLNLGTVRGSSSKGGLSVLREAVKLMQEERQHACMTVDGPRGPRHEPKDGAVYLAHHVPARIVPVRLYASKTKVFQSWDRFQLPLPFCSVRVLYGDPYAVEAPELTREVLDQERQKLKDKLELLT
jgi:lysophospholipid acyltransferase (LPLAT)-like uncharacterized protein